MPLVDEVAHDQCVIKGNGANGKHALVREERRLDVLNSQGPYLPVVGLEPNAVEAVAVASDGVANTAALEVSGRLGQRGEAGGGWKSISLSGTKLDRHLTIARANGQGDQRAVISHIEICQLMLARKNASPRPMIEHRARVAAWNEHALPRRAGRLVPENGDAVCGVFTGDTAKFREPVGTYPLQSNEANPGNRVATVKFGSEGCRQEASHHLLFHPKVYKQPATN